jgi:Bacterial PH domain/Short C-terminal domain
MAQSTLRFQPGEEMVLDMVPLAFWTWPRYLYTFGLWAIWRSRHRFVLTKQRVVMTAGIISRRERTVPLAKVQDVTLRRSINSGGHLILSSAGGVLGVERIGPLSRVKASAFADELGSRFHSGHDGVSYVTGPTRATPTSVAFELEHLAALRDRGILSEEEFTEQKTKLLSR